MSLRVHGEKTRDDPAGAVRAEESWADEDFEIRVVARSSEFEPEGATFGILATMCEYMQRSDSCESAQEDPNWELLEGSPSSTVRNCTPVVRAAGFQNEFGREKMESLGVAFIR